MLNALTVKTFLVLWAILLCIFIIVWAIAGHNKRKRLEERRLDFSKCYHNQPHAFDGSSFEDIYCCDICGRPYSDVLHRIK